MDLRNIPILDNHCHFFSTSFDDRPLYRMLSLSLNKMPDEQLRHSLLYHAILAGLAEVLGSRPEESELLAVRREFASSDYKSYVEKLMQQVNLKWMLVDIGLQKSAVNFQTFEDLVPFRVRYVYRIETVVDRLWREGIPAAQGLAQFREEVRQAVRELDAVALKSIIGYRTGLEIDPSVKAEDLDGKGSEGAYRSLFFLEAARICREFSIPLHVHAAFGESNLDLRTNNPLHLKAFLDSHAAEGINVVLIHGGYPYAFEAGYLAAMYPNVHIDISEIIPFVSLGMQRGVEDIMSMCPLNKIMYGSDGFDVPETHWYGASAAKEILSNILEKLTAEGKIEKQYAEEVARMILYKNSLRLHGLDEEAI